ncbi:MAG: hypothetical protein JW976_01860 [Syntrophaceae bacterium]|nr:hypothetical protein [Syntrophaceae bacterium]
MEKFLLKDGFNNFGVKKSIRKLVVGPMEPIIFLAELASAQCKKNYLRKINR